MALDLKVVNSVRLYQRSLTSSKASGPGLVAWTVGAKYTRFLVGFDGRKAFITSMNSCVVGIEVVAIVGCVFL